MSFTLSAEGVVNPKSLQIIYYEGINGVDGELLFAGVASSLRMALSEDQWPSDEEVLFLMTQTMVTKVDVKGAVYFSLGYKYYKAYRHTNDAILVEKTLQPADIAGPKVDGEGVMNARFLWRHKQNLEAAKKKPDLVFFGDSLTEGWAADKDATSTWLSNFGMYRPANFGIGGDMTQHVLWRIENGELDGFMPKTVVLMIGTNNTRGYSSDEIASGIKKIIEAIRKRCPETKILLLGVLPRGLTNDPARPKIPQINASISRLDDGQHVFFRDFKDRFLNSDGTLKQELMYDLLHFSKKGYEVFAEALKPVVDELMQG